MKHARSLLVVAIALAVAVSGARDASAGGYLVARFGGEHGHPTTDHTSAIYYNPAGLALGHGTRFYVEGLFGYRLASYERPEGAIDNPGTGTPDGAIDANAGKATLSDPVAAPFIAAATDFGVDGLAVAIGAYVPFGGQATWDENEDFAGNTMFPGAVDGVQRWFTIEGSIRSTYLTGAAAWRFEAARLSVGVGVNLVISDIAAVRARTSIGTDDVVSSDGSLLEGRSLLDVSDVTVSAGAGLLWQPTDRIWIGVSYQSQPGFGEMEFEGELVNKLGEAPVAPTDVVVTQELPDVIRAGFRMRPVDRWEVRLSGDYARWSVFDDFCGMEASTAERGCKLQADGTADPDGASIVFNLRRDWKDTFGVRVGGSFWPRPDVELVAGAGFDSSAVPDETLEPSLMDMNKASASLGARFRLLDERLALSATYVQVFYFERTIEPRERDGDGTPITDSGPSRVPDGAGTYNQSIGFLTLGAEYAF